METTMNATRSLPLRDKLRVVLAITAKDMLEGLRNKTTLTAIVTTVMMIALYRYLPLITDANDPPRVFLYAATPSEALADLEFGSSLQVGQSPTLDALERRIGAGNDPELGLVVPPDFDALVAAGETPELTGYVVQWVSPEEADQLVRQVEDGIYAETGLNVQIVLADKRVDPAIDNDGVAFMASLGTVFTLCMLGISFVPHLMMEEKSSRTLDALMVSPASSWMVVASKALTGVLYGLLLGVPSLLIYGPVIQQWGVAGLALLAGVSFTISVGLLLGMLVNTQQQLMAWAWVAIIPLILPPFIIVLSGLIPEWLASLLPWIPTVAVSLLIRASAAAYVPLDFILRNLAVILAGTGIVLAITASLVRRRDR